MVFGESRSESSELRLESRLLQVSSAPITATVVGCQRTSYRSSLPPSLDHNAHFGESIAHGLWIPIRRGPVDHVPTRR